MTAPERRAFLVGIALPAGGLNPRATCDLSHTVTSRARTMDELGRLVRAMDRGMACGFLVCLAGLLSGTLLVMVHRDLPGALLAVGPYLGLHALWHYHMRRA